MAINKTMHQLYVAAHLVGPPCGYFIACNGIKAINVFARGSIMNMIMCSKCLSIKVKTGAVEVAAV